jgi:hypothetical protein
VNEPGDARSEWQDDFGLRTADFEPRRAREGDFAGRDSREGGCEKGFSHQR